MSSVVHSEDIELNLEKGTIADPPEMSRWGQTARIIREGDKLKIRDYKEDIDTLLVFAGLFSAVITAFLVDSYKTLKFDPTNDILQALTRISEQLAANASLSDPSPPAFTPSNNFVPPEVAVVTNAAWFASLIISLMAASYGMLVKQWLREFLAVKFASPLAGLLVRCFRYPGLIKWKVFEIAAVFPLLLQLALGLFFTGLCFFASSIHIALKWTTIPLVALWATLILSATLAPLFSSQCPYKSTFFKGPMRKGRVLVWALRNLFTAWVNKDFGSMRKVQGPRPIEEENVAHSETTDLDVLQEVIGVVREDDTLVATAITEITAGARLDRKNVTSFISIVFGHGSGRGRRSHGCSSRPKLSRPIWDAMTRVLVNTLHQTKLDFTTKEADKWVQEIFAVLFRSPQYPLPDTASKTLSQFLSQPQHTKYVVSKLVNDVDWRVSTVGVFIEGILQHATFLHRDANKEIQEIWIMMMGKVTSAMERSFVREWPQFALSIFSHDSNPFFLRMQKAIEGSQLEGDLQSQLTSSDSKLAVRQLSAIIRLVIMRPEERQQPEALTAIASDMMLLSGSLRLFVDELLVFALEGVDDQRRLHPEKWGFWIYEAIYVLLCRSDTTFDTSTSTLECISNYLLSSPDKYIPQLLAWDCHPNRIHSEIEKIALTTSLLKCQDIILRGSEESRPINQITTIIDQLGTSVLAVVRKGATPEDTPILVLGIHTLIARELSDCDSILDAAAQQLEFLFELRRGPKAVVETIFKVARGNLDALKIFLQCRLRLWQNDTVTEDFLLRYLQEYGADEPSLSVHGLDTKGIAEEDLMMTTLSTHLAKLLPRFPTIYWPVWMKTKISGHIWDFISNPDYVLPPWVEQCMKNDISEFFSLFLEQGGYPAGSDSEWVERLSNRYKYLIRVLEPSLDDSLASSLLLRSFNKHSDPMEPQGAERLLLQLLVKSVKSPAARSANELHDDASDMRPLRAVLSLSVRIINHYIDIRIPSRNLKTPPQLQGLDSEVKNDVFCAALRVHELSTKLTDGNAVRYDELDMIRQDAEILVLATRPSKNNEEAVLRREMEVRAKDDEIERAESSESERRMWKSRQAMKHRRRRPLTRRRELQNQKIHHATEV